MESSFPDENVEIAGHLVLSKKIGVSGEKGLVEGAKEGDEEEKWKENEDGDEDEDEDEDKKWQVPEGMNAEIFREVNRLAPEMDTKKNVKHYGNPNHFLKKKRAVNSTLPLH